MVSLQDLQWTVGTLRLIVSIDAVPGMDLRCEVRSGGSRGERMLGVGLEAAQPQAVGDDEDAGEGHRCAGEHWVEEAGGGEGEGGDVVSERPEQVALDRGQGSPGEADGG